MDVDSLRAELETHLAKNPDDVAPGGFRDRFETLVAQYQAADDEIPKPQVEAMLQQIRAEAEAAWTSVGPGRGEDFPPRLDQPPPRAEPVARPPHPGDPVSERMDPQAIQPAGFMQRYGLVLIGAVVVLGLAYYFLRR